MESQSRSLWQALDPVTASYSLFEVHQTFAESTKTVLRERFRRHFFVDPQRERLRTEKNASKMNPLSLPFMYERKYL